MDGTGGEDCATADRPAVNLVPNRDSMKATCTAPPGSAFFSGCCLVPVVAPGHKPSRWVTSAADWRHLVSSARPGPRERSRSVTAPNFIGGAIATGLDASVFVTHAAAVHGSGSRPTRGNLILEKEHHGKRPGRPAYPARFFRARLRGKLTAAINGQELIFRFDVDTIGRPHGRRGNPGSERALHCMANGTACLCTPREAHDCALSKRQGDAYRPYRPPAARHDSSVANAR